MSLVTPSPQVSIWPQKYCSSSLVTSAEICRDLPVLAQAWNVNLLLLVFFGGLGRKQNKDECWKCWFTHPELPAFPSHFNARGQLDKLVRRIYLVIYIIFLDGLFPLSPPTSSHRSFLTPNRFPEPLVQDCKLSKYKHFHFLHFQNIFQYIARVGRLWQKIDAQ